MWQRLGRLGIIDDLFFFNAAFAAVSKTSWTPCWILAEHSTYAWAFILFAMTLVFSVHTGTCFEIRNKELRYNSVNLPYSKSFKFEQQSISIALLVLSLQGCQSFLDRLLDRFCFQPISQEHLYKSAWLLLPIVLQHSPESRGLKED